MKKKYFNYLFKFRIYKIFLISIYAIPLIFLIRLIKPFLFVKLIHIRSDRIGHFVVDGAMAIIKNNHNKNLNIYYFSQIISNNQWNKMIRRNLYVNNFFRDIAYINSLIPFGIGHNEDAATDGSRDINGLFYTTDKAQLKFTKTEEQKCLKWLLNVGIKKNDKYICFLMRDEKYLSVENKSNTNFSYHEFRNTELDSYNKGIQYLLDQNIYVIRMGKHMKKTFNFLHPKLIDYAFNETKNDCLDIWLFANCFGCITTGTGPDVLSSIYNKPTLFLNFIPFLYLHSFSNSLTIPKTITWKANNKKLTLTELDEYSFQNYYDYISNGIKITDLTQHDIFKAVKEFLSLMNSSSKYNEHEIMKEKNFWKKLKKTKTFQRNNQWIHSNAKIGKYWIKKNYNDLML